MLFPGVVGSSILTPVWSDSGRNFLTKEYFRKNELSGIMSSTRNKNPPNPPTKSRTLRRAVRGPLQYMKFNELS